MKRKISFLIGNGYPISEKTHESREELLRRVTDCIVNNYPFQLVTSQSILIVDSKEILSVSIEEVTD